MKNVNRRKSLACSAVCCLVILVAAPASYSAEPASPPSDVRELAQTRESHAFLAVAHQREPLDLAKHGYVETEYVVSGEARVLEWPRESTLQALARGRYTTRILVRRPRDETRFNGTAIVEALNPSSPVDLPIMWAQSHAQLIADGYAWVGVTIKPNTIRSLQRFDPDRYAALAMPHPEGGPSCAPDAINAWSQPTTPADETGLAWDILSQVGALLKTQRRDHPLRRPAERLYMTGQSQTAGYARTYASAFGRLVTDADGTPLYDAYLYSGSPPWQVPLYQCARDLAPDDPRLITAAAGVPIIEIFAEGDLGTNTATRRPDSDTRPDLFRRYEVAGAAHADTWQERSFASGADMIRATGQPSGTEPECEPRDMTPSDFPIRYVLNAAWQTLDAWVRDGVPPPRAAPLELLAGGRDPFEPERAFATDEHGNAKGGVRTPHVDVPTARWVGAKTGAFQCMFRGYKYPFDAATLARLYPSREDYVAKVRASAEALAAARWLTPEDAAAIVRDASAVDLAAVRPEEVGLSAERLARIDTAMEEAIAEQRIAGAVTLVARRGRLAHYRAHGFADLASKRPMRRDDLFRIYSMTKPVVSVALLMLYEEGKFQLGDPLERYIPSFASVKVLASVDADGRMMLEEPRRLPTIHDAFRHTAGLASGLGRSPVDARYRELGLTIDKLESLRMEVEALGTVPLVFHPGERWLYGLNHDVQAYLVEHFSGMPLDEFLESRLFGPLGMNDTVFGIPRDRAARFATSYVAANGTLEVGETAATGPYTRFNGRPFGTFGLSSTAMDYARFAQMLADGGELNGVRILGRKTVDLMRQNHLPPAVATQPPFAPGGSGYGLGVSVTLDPAALGNLDSKGSFGWSGASTTKFYVDPAEELVAIIMTQRTPFDAALLDRFQTLVYQAIVD